MFKIYFFLFFGSLLMPKSDASRTIISRNDSLNNVRLASDFVIFQEIDHFPVWKTPENDQISELIGKKITLNGKLTESSKDSFYLESYVLENDQIVFYRYKIEADEAKKQLISGKSWVKIDGIFSKPYDNGYFPVVQIQNLEILAINENIRKAESEAAKVFRANIKKYDLNSFKKSPFFMKIRLEHVQNLDFNKTKFLPSYKIIGFDMLAKIMFIEVGKNILYEDKIRRGDFLSFVALYDLEKQKVSKILLYNSGYFLE